MIYKVKLDGLTVPIYLNSRDTTRVVVHSDRSFRLNWGADSSGWSHRYSTDKQLEKAIDAVVEVINAAAGSHSL